MSHVDCDGCVHLKTDSNEVPCKECSGDFDKFEAAPDKAKELADAHWAYVKEVLTTHCSPEAKAFIGEIGFHYKTAFVHGYKHGKER